MFGFVLEKKVMNWFWVEVKHLWVATMTNIVYIEGQGWGVEFGSNSNSKLVFDPILVVIVWLIESPVIRPSAYVQFLV